MRRSWGISRLSQTFDEDRGVGSPRQDKAKDDFFSSRINLITAPFQDLKIVGNDDGRPGKGLETDPAQFLVPEGRSGQ
jgi:hypothetical protein